MNAYSPDAIRAESISITGHGGDEIEAYRAIPLAEELTEESALALADAIRNAIAHAPAGLASREQ